MVGGGESGGSETTTMNCPFQEGINIENDERFEDFLNAGRG